MLKKISPDLLSILVILIVVPVTFCALTGSCFTMKWDMLDQFLPCRYFITECLNHHIFPLWCSYINFGYPFYADPQSGLFYPITWLIALTTGYNVYTIAMDYVLHVAIAAIAFFYLLRSFDSDRYTALVFALIYCMSGVFIGNAQHLPWIITMAWMPLIMFNFKALFDNGTWKNALALALFLYLALTGGYPGFFIILFYFFAVYAAIKIGFTIKANGVSGTLPFISLSCVAVIGFIILAGGYLYSFTNSLPYIARGKPVSLEAANNIGITPHSVISFLFPFATACTSFKLGTDISMANVYCGFLMLPLLFIALIKTRWQYFHKAIFAFALICLLAAAGKYFYVRTWFYNFLPGMNMLRHAAIFRVFTVFGFIFIVAIGFNWIVVSIRAKTNSRFIKITFAVYFLLLAAAFIAALFKTNFSLTLLPIFNRAAIADFNAHQSVYSHITAQLAFQIPLLFAFILVLFLQQIKASFRLALLSSVAIAEIFISVQLNLPATVISDVQPATLQAKLNKFGQGFPVPALTAMSGFTQFSDGTTLPIWYNISFFKKIPAKDGFNSFYLQNLDDLASSPKQDSFLQKPIVFFSHAESKFEIKKFEPGNVVIQCQTSADDTIHLQQNYYKGWLVFVDDKKGLPDHELCSMSASITAGAHTVRFEFHQKRAEYLLVISMTSALLLVCLLLIATLRKKLNQQSGF